MEWHAFKGHQRKILGLARSIFYVFFTCVGFYHRFLLANKQVSHVEYSCQKSLVLLVNLNHPHQKGDLMSQSHLPALLCSELQRPQ